jgi:hypothetical protein
MAEELPELRAIVERNAEAVMAGNFMQIMADITPEALAKLMAMAPPGGGPSIATLPALTGYTLELLEPADEAQLYRATFTSEQATATFVTTWRQVVGQWKVVDFSDVSIEMKDGSPGPL